MGILDRIKIALGASYNYNKHSHTFDSSTIREGDMKQISKDEYIKNEKGRIIYCKIGKNGKPKCIKTPFKSR